MLQNTSQKMLAKNSEHVIKLPLMRYDFRKIQRAYEESGKTLQQLGAACGLHHSTISKALKNNRAHQSTAIALLNYFGMTMKDISRSRRTA